MAVRMRERAEIMDEEAMQRAVTRMAHEIIERNKEIQDVALIGIQRRGVPLAQRLAAAIRKVEGIDMPVGVLDITLYRDDLSLLNEHPVLNSTDIPFTVNGKHLVMVDDVIYTGRTARTAMDVLIEMGRPRRIQLAVLIDRGHRELPIRPDYVGKNVPTSQNEVIGVHVQTIDGCESVTLYEMER